MRVEIRLGRKLPHALDESVVRYDRVSYFKLDLLACDRRPKVLQDCISGIRDRYALEYRVVCQDGSHKWLLARGAAVQRDADGRALRLVGTLVDVSKRKQIEADLLAAAQFQQAVFDSISAQIAVLDQAGNIVQTNAAWQSYADQFEFGASLGQNYLALLAGYFVVAKATRDALVAGMAEVAAGVAPHFHLPEPVQCNCGSYWFTIKFTPVRDAAHRMVVTHEDVSALKQAELASAALANVDNLTGALSRQHFLQLAEQELARSQRYELPLVVLMLGAYQPSVWNIRWTPGTRILAAVETGPLGLCGATVTPSESCRKSAIFRG